MAGNLFTHKYGCVHTHTHVHGKRNKIAGSKIVSNASRPPISYTESRGNIP